MAFREELELAVVAAQSAGVVLHDAFLAPKKVLREEARDIKLSADVEAEEVILNVLRGSGYSTLAEESGETGNIQTNQPFWIVDPLDGTMNFSRSIPFCCVSIALYQQSTPLLGVIYDFNRGELFTSIREEGAWMNNEPIAVSDVKKAGDAMLATGAPLNFVYDDAGFQKYMRTIQRFRKVRQLGSAALSLAWVACGRLDAYHEDDIMFWDIAAGVALLQAAGGFVCMNASETCRWGRRVRCAACETIWFPVTS